MTTESIPLRSLVDGVGHACESVANAVTNLGKGVTTPQIGIRSMAAECLATKTVLRRVQNILATWDSDDLRTALEADGRPPEKLEACFEVLVHSISKILLDVNYEIKRLRRYSTSGDPLASAKYVPALRDVFIDAKIDLRRKRSSLCLVLDCLQSGNLLGATIQLLEETSLTQLPSGKLGSSKLEPVLTIEPPKLSDRHDVRHLLVKYRPKGTRPGERDPKLIRRLRNAIIKCDRTVVHKCLAMKVDPNAQLEQVGTSPVHQALDTVEASLACDNVAAARASTSIVTDLVIAGADLHELDEHGRTPLIRAAMNEMPSFLVSLMLEFGSSANARDRQKNTALHHAATRALSDETANLDTIQVLVVHGADQSLRNRRGRTPLHEAISFGRLQCAQMLLDYGANLETTDSNGWTPLFGAVVQGSAVLTKLMCDRGAVVDKKDRSGQTALRYAISQGCGEVAEALLEAGADVNLVTKGETPLCQATSKSNLSLLELLLARDADVSLPSPSYCDALPIHIAAMGRDPAILEVLLRAGSPINARDAEGRTPLRWAINDGGGEMVHFLFSKGAAK